MNWDEIFKDYIEVKNDEKKIYSFCDKNDNWMPELQHIFLHNTESEMFILLDLKKAIKNRQIIAFLSNSEETKGGKENE